MPAEAEKKLLDTLDEGAAAFSSALTHEHYLNGSGQKDDLAIVSLYERHASLFTQPVVEKVLRARTRDRRLGPLREFVVDGHLDRAAKEVTEQIADRETADEVVWEGESIAYRSVFLRVMNEPDPARRHALDARRLEVTAAQNGLRRERWRLLYRQTESLGFESYRQLYDRLGGLNLDSLARELERLLFETSASYRSQLEPALAAAGANTAYAERSDLARLFRQPRFDAAFPSGRMLDALDATLRALGVDVDRQENVHIDAEVRPRKSPRAFCAPVTIPDDIYLVIYPHGGHDDYRALFHEAGHAQHFAHVDRTMPFAFRGLGDNSVTEGFAFVLEHLMYNEVWLKEHLGLEDVAEYLAFVRLHRLYFLRRYGAKLLYEVQLHGSHDVDGIGKRYADLLTAHVGVRHSPEDYLSDLDDGFYCARYLRAWAFDAQVRAWFEGRWGRAWFSVPEAGAALRELWAFGQRYRAEELLKRLGEDELSFAPLVRELSQP